MQITRRISTSLKVALVLACSGCLVAADAAAADPSTMDWPNWRGPTCSGSTADCGEPLVDDISKAKLLWVSEEDIPSNAWSQDEMGSRHGSYGSPIIADAKVFVSYQYGKGTDWKKSQNAQKEGGEALRDYFACDYVVVALDALTGKTVWRTVVDQGPNMSLVRGWASHEAPCFYRGKIYAQSNLGRIYCLDAKDGKVLWQADSYKTADQVKLLKIYGDMLQMHGNRGMPADAFKGKDVPRLARFTHPVMVADGVVIAYAAPRIDAETGEVIGHAVHYKDTGNIKDDTSTPVRWAAAGPSTSSGQAKEYIIKDGKCYEPRSGKVLWNEKKTRSNRAPVLGGGYLVALSHVGMKCFAISPEGAQEKWMVEFPKGQKGGGSHPGVIHKGWYYAKVYWGDPKKDKNHYLLAVELATGKQLPRAVAGAGKSGYPCPVASNGRLLFTVTHSGFGVYMAERRDDAMHIFPGLISRQDSRQGHAYTPALADGRLYLRCADDIKCYDLRAASAAE